MARNFWVEDDVLERAAMRTPQPYVRFGYRLLGIVAGKFGNNLIFIEDQQGCFGIQDEFHLALLDQDVRARCMDDRENAIEFIHDGGFKSRLFLLGKNVALFTRRTLIFSATPLKPSIPQRVFLIFPQEYLSEEIASSGTMELSINCIFL